MNALIVTDIQNDFLPGGALAVPQGDRVVPVANRLMAKFELVVATQDWHPPDHLSFASRHPGKRVGDAIDVDGLEQILWPDHCVQNTPGAAFAPALNTDEIDRVFHKGTDRRIDSYSCFYDNAHRKATGLGEFLTSRGVETVYVIGLATDYCIKFSALDAAKLGFATKVVLEGVRGVELNPGDCARAIEEMKAAGVEMVREVDL